MGKTLSEIENKDIVITQVVRTGEKLIIPESMDLDQAIVLLAERMKPAAKDESIDAKIHKLVNKALAGEELAE